MGLKEFLLLLFSTHDVSEGHFIHLGGREEEKGLD